MKNSRNENDSENEIENDYMESEGNEVTITSEKFKDHHQGKNKDRIEISKTKKGNQKLKKRLRHQIKRHGSYSTQHEMWASDSYVDHSLAPPSAKPLFNWEHVLLAVQDYADSLLKLNSSNITVCYNQYFTCQCVTVHVSNYYHIAAQFYTVLVR